MNAAGVAIAGSSAGNRLRLSPDWPRGCGQNGVWRLGERQGEQCGRRLAGGVFGTSRLGHSPPSATSTFSSGFYFCSYTCAKVYSALQRRRSGFGGGAGFRPLWPSRQSGAPACTASHNPRRMHGRISGWWGATLRHSARQRLALAEFSRIEPRVFFPDTRGSILAEHSGRTESARNAASNAGSAGSNVMPYCRGAKRGGMQGGFGGEPINADRRHLTIRTRSLPSAGVFSQRVALAGNAKAQLPRALLTVFRTVGSTAQRTPAIAPARSA